VDAVWVGLGIVVLVLTLADVFLTALNYDEAGFIAGRLASWQWRLTRRFTRGVARRWRPVVLRQVTGLQIMVTVVAWLGGTILGYRLIYFGLMRGKSFVYSGASADLFNALYYSAAQLATVGSSKLTPNTDVLSALSVAETLTGVVLVSLTLTFLLGVYDVVSSLRSLSSQFYSPGNSVGEPITSLVPYFPDRQESGLDAHLQSISESFAAYADGVRFHHAAYYFQSGRDTFSLPYSLQMLGGTIGAVRWGLPASHPVTRQPTLLPLIDQFGKLADYLHDLVRWQSPEAPETVTSARFARQAKGALAGEEPRHRRRIRDADDGDPWVRRFVQVNLDMAELAGAEPLADLDEAYDRYVSWLPFASRAQQFSDAISHDLDYQPVRAAPRDQAPAAVLRPAPPPRTRRDDEDRGLRAFRARRLTLTDPGYSRLLSAVRALAAAGLAVVVVAIGLPAFGFPAMPAAIFGGMMAMFAGSAPTGTGHGLHRLTALITAVPVILALALSAIVPHDPVPTIITLTLVAFAAVAVSRLGPAFAGLGQLAFVAYYFTLLLRLEASEFVPFSIAALVGVLASVVVMLVPNKGAHARVVKGGVAALNDRTSRALDPLIDAVSGARWDPELARRTRSQLRQAHQLSAFLSGQLTGRDPDIGLTVDQAEGLRVRVHDVELALANLAAKARMATGATIPLAVRAHLAGALESLQERIAGHTGPPEWVKHSSDDSGAARAAEASEPLAAPEVFPSPATVAGWPHAARRVIAAATELEHASEILNSAHPPDLALSPDPGVGPVARPEGETATGSDRRTVDVAPIWRRSVQAGLATGLALFLGSFVSSSHQYWAAMPAYQALGGSDGETFIKGSERVIGTTLGAIVGFAIAITAGPNPAVLFPMLGVCVFATVYFRAASAPLMVFWQTMLFAALYEYLGRLDSEAIGVRVLETIIGAAVAVAVATLVLPTRTCTRFRGQAAQWIHALDSLTATTIELWRRGRPLSRTERSRLSQAQIAATEQMRQIEVTARPLRHGAGAFDPSGIENQITGLWELLYFAKKFVSAAERSPRAEARLKPQQWARLETATEENFASLAAVYEGRAGGPVGADIGVDDLGDPDEPRDAEEALRALARMNETIALLADDAAPQPSRFLARRRRS